MKTARYYGIEDIRYEELPVPNCGEKDVLIKVAYAGICGSDLHIYKKGHVHPEHPGNHGA